MSDEEASDGENPQVEVSGWADAMSKILGSNKPQKKKKLILSRAKKDYEVKQPSVEVKKDNIEIVQTEEEPSKDTKQPTKRKKATNDNEDNGEVSLKKQRKLELKQKRLQKEWENMKRVKPQPTADKEAERILLKIATKGVVELFNAVNLQKKTLGKKLREAPKSEFQKDKILSQTKDLFEDAMEKVHTGKGKRK